MDGAAVASPLPTTHHDVRQLSAPTSLNFGSIEGPHPSARRFDWVFSDFENWVYCTVRVYTGLGVRACNQLRGED